MVSGEVMPCGVIHVCLGHPGGGELGSSPGTRCCSVGAGWNMDLSTQQNRVPFSIDIWKLDLSSFRDARASGVVNGKKNTVHSAPGRRLALATVVLVE